MNIDEIKGEVSKIGVSATEYAEKLSKEMAEIRDIIHKVQDVFGDQPQGRNLAEIISRASAHTGTAGTEMLRLKSETSMTVGFLSR